MQLNTSESFAVAHNVALIAGCTGAAKHAHWVEKLNPVKRVYIMFTKADSVLAGATAIDRDVKLGTNPGSELLISPKYRYVDFEGAKGMIFGAHRYFVVDPDKKLSKQAEKLFRRLVSSEIDFSSDENLKVVYPVNCKADGSVCYMGGGSGSADGG
jgi:hypothetical protein